MAGDTVDFPPWDRIYAFFRRWRDNALVKEFHDRLRGKLREELGRDAQPTAAVIDSQSVKRTPSSERTAAASTAASWSTAASGTSWSTPSACCWE
ncbi:hypothetical protein GCM10018789_59650 [Streptomyces werraensis]|nr:hypothetical protein GCM10018789_59650 [Streptomyces werraensis]